MSIPSAIASPAIRGSHTRPANLDGNASERPAFSRKPVAGQSVRAAQAGRAQAAEPMPFRALAQDICVGGQVRHDWLKRNLTLNPSYFGRHHGHEEVFFNKETGEVAVHDLELDRKTGLAGLLDIFKFDMDKPRSTILVKKDGQIYIDGKILTKAHPDAAKIFAALDELRYDLPARNYGFVRNKFIAHLAKPAWDPSSERHPHYVA